MDGVRRGRKFWERLVAKFEGAGAADVHEEFCERHGVKCDSFRRWLYRLRAEKRGRAWSDRGAARAQARAAGLALSLVEVGGTGGGGGASAAFEIDLGGGRRVRVPAAFDEAALRRLLGVLAELRP